MRKRIVREEYQGCLSDGSSLTGLKFIFIQKIFTETTKSGIRIHGGMSIAQAEIILEIPYLLISSC